MKRQATDWEEIHLRHISGFVSRIQKEHSKLSKKVNNPFSFKSAKDLKRHLGEEDTWMAVKPIKMCST